MGRQGGRAGGSPWRDTTHTRQPLHRPACGRCGSLKRLTQQRGNGALSWLHAGVQVCRCAGVPAGEGSLTSSQALPKRQAGRTCGTPRMGSPTVANTKERAQTFHACTPSSSFLLSCRVHYFLLHLTMVGDWRGCLTGQGSLVAWVARAAVRTV